MRVSVKEKWGPASDQMSIKVMCSFSVWRVGSIRWLFPPVTQGGTTAMLLKEGRCRGIGYRRERSMMPDHVNYSDNFITAVTILFSPFTLFQRDTVCMVHLKIFRGNSESPGVQS